MEMHAMATRDRVPAIRVTYDDQVDMAYIYLADSQPGAINHVEPLIIDLPTAGRRLINLDFDQGGHLLGIEIDGARSGLPALLLESAEKV